MEMMVALGMGSAVTVELGDKGMTVTFGSGDKDKGLPNGY